MPTPTDAYKSGRLAEAVAAAIEQVKTTPADRGKRLFLAELFVYAGDLERADKQLDVLASPDAKELMALTLFRQLLRAETARREVFTKGRAPEVLAPPSECVKLHLEAVLRVRENDLAGAAELVAKAEAIRPRPKGKCDGTAFDDLRDLDDLTAPVLEVLTSNGNYYWVELGSVDSLEFDKPERARDLYWRPARLIVRDGPDGVVYVPTLYHGSHTATDEALKLGRGTDWAGGEGQPSRGLGLREFLVGESGKSILEIGRVEFTR